MSYSVPGWLRRFRFVAGIFFLVWNPMLGAQVVIWVSLATATGCVSSSWG